MTNTRIIYLSALNGVILGIMCMLFALAVLPLKYQADARILVAPHMIPGVDPYTSSKSAERIAQNLADVVQTSSFFKRVVSLTSSGIDITYFPQDELKRRKVWGQTVEAGVQYNSGILRVSAFHSDPVQAEKIAGAVAQVLSTSGNDFSLSAADLRVVDSPVASKYPKQPNFIVIALGGLLGGFVISAVFLSLRRDF